MLTALLLTLLLQDTPKPDLPPEDLKLNTGPLVYSGARPHVAVFASGELAIDTDPFEGDGFTLNYETKTFRAIGIGFTSNHGLIRTSFTFMYGEWEGEGTLSVPDQNGGVAHERVDLTGRMLGTELDIYWPALVICFGSLELAAGPQIGGHFIVQQVDDFDDYVPEFAGSIGPRVSLRISAAKVGFSVDAGLNYLFGSLEGPVAQASASLSF